MNIKKIYNQIICLLISGSFLTGCFDLDYENYSKINSENFPQSEADLYTATIGVYHTLSKSFVMLYLENSGFLHNTLTTDEMNTSWGHVWEQTAIFTWAANNMAGKDVYEQYHKGITKATRIIDAFEKSSVEDNKKAKFIAELRVLRILYANYLYSMVGAVPIVTDPDIANDVYTNWTPTRPTNEEFVSFMTTEIEQSYSLLDKVISPENFGRLSQGAALTLLMKIYMNDKQWQKAAETSQKIIDLGIYDLLPSYKAVFNINNEGASNKEIIFPIQRITSNSEYAWTYFACVMPATPMYKSEIGIQMEIWGGLKMPWEFYDKYEANDARLETIIRYYTDTDGNYVDYRTVDHPKATGAVPMKYSEDPDQQGANQGNDFIVFRYADVLLSRAEALNEIYGPTKECIDLINLVRDRANASLIKLEDYNKETLKDFLLDERGRELYCEGHRRPDLIRFGKFIEKAREKGIDAKDYHVLFPIPQSAMNENPNLVQNPGYEK